jgi:predicted phage terminase large subunit-like protein
MTINEDIKNDFLLWSRYSFEERNGFPFATKPHHYVIAEALEKVVLGYITRLIINIPPRSGKTELAVKCFIAWSLGHFPDAEFLHASNAKSLAATNTAATRAVIQHPSWAKFFGAPQFRRDVNAKHEFKLKQGGGVYAAGTNGTIMGYGAGKKRDFFGGAIIIDDPNKPTTVRSEVIRTSVIEWYKNTIKSRKNAPNTPIIVIMQRLHEEDLAGWLLNGGSGEEWHHIKVPGVTENGESFWEEQFPIKDYLIEEKVDPYNFAGQVMQEPAPLGGGILKNEWWQYYTVEPQFEHKSIYVDTAQKTGQENDYTVFQCWGTTKNNQLYLIDQLRGKYEAPELMAMGRAFYYKHKSNPNGTLRKMAVEDKVSGTDLIQTLRREGIAIVPIPRHKDKTTRGIDASYFIESGNVFLPRDAPYLADFLAEAAVFPNGRHDDQLDPCFDAIADIQSPRRTPLVGKYGS